MGERDVSHNLGSHLPNYMLVKRAISAIPCPTIKRKGNQIHQIQVVQCSVIVPTNSTPSLDVGHFLSLVKICDPFVLLHLQHNNRLAERSGLFQQRHDFDTH